MHLAMAHASHLAFSIQEVIPQLGDDLQLHSQLGGDFATWFAAAKMEAWAAKWHSCAKAPICTSFQLRFAHRLKHWTPNFPSFKTKYSMHEMDSRNCSSVKFSEKHDSPQAAEIEIGLPPNEESRERIHEDDVATNRRVSWRTINATQERDIDSRRKGKAPKRISSSSTSDDGDNGTVGGGVGTGWALEKLVPLVRVMLVKWILACHGHKEMKITMPHKIQIMDIDQGYGNSKSIWKG
ncbi:hypothetical protein CK203_097220 [Vitis vinifera]|uniref:Uncharacterized protein n=1 Tax=Vitis vinifera TaxID=29760 RepID=A0A438DIZ7_VITVI|nr:hypothetical protein CK203_097220 [Vitis vinifera]